MDYAWLPELRAYNLHLNLETGQVEAFGRRWEGCPRVVRPYQLDPRIGPDDDPCYRRNIRPVDEWGWLGKAAHWDSEGI